jgi:TAT (twin-arginine translocation) pathway signal sequence
MSVSRRSVLKGASVLGAASALPMAAAAKPPALAIYDSRLPESRLFARAERRNGTRTFDIAPGDSALVALARADLAVPGRVIGMTGWSDWVALRGLMEDRGKRLTHETRIPHKGARMATPFAWGMA